MAKWNHTHAALRAAALHLFAENGYDATPTADVARHAGVSEMTLFRHFPNKELLVVGDPYDPVMSDAVRQRPKGERPMRALTEGIRSALRSIPASDIASLREPLRIVAHTPSLHGALERNSADTVDALASALEDRGVGGNVAQVAATSIVAGMSRALLDWSADESQDLIACLDDALDVLGGR